MWIKICGNTSLEDAQMAVEYGADALGFVFASSPRQVTGVQVRQIVSHLPSRVETYGVFVDEDFAGIVRAVTECGLTGVQVHSSLDTDFAARLREHFAGLARKVSIVRVFRRAAMRERLAGERKPAGSEEPESGEAADFDRELSRCSRDPAVDAVLVDSFATKAPGGTGTSFDWGAAQASFQRAMPGMRLIVAGGLRPENVRSAISMLRPWGVDVVSGVEAAPGKKDRTRVRAFIQAARDAEAEFSGHPVLLGLRNL